MRWKVWSLITLLSSCLAINVTARPQREPRGISIIVVGSESAASRIRERIRAGASFEAMALANSTDPSAARGGYVGQMEESSLSVELSNSLSTLTPGAVSRVTPVGNAFLLVKWATDAEERWRTQNGNAISALSGGRYSDAESLFLEAVRQAEQFGPDDIRLAESLNGLAQIHRYQQRFQEAETRARRSLAIFDRAVGPSSKASLPSLVNLAGIARSLQRYEEAEQLYRRVLAIRWGGSPQSEVSAEEVLEKLAEVLHRAYARDAGLEPAIEEYWRSVTKSSLDKDLFRGMRDLLISVSLFPHAESLMQRAVRLQPRSRQLQVELAEVYVSSGKYESAIEAFAQAVPLNDGSSDVSELRQRSRIYTTIAQMNFYLVRFDEAFKALNTALANDAENTPARMLLGALYLRRNEFDPAVREYQRVISFNPRAADAYEGLAQASLSAGRFADAVRDSDIALGINPALQSSRYLKAMALIRDGRDSEGRLVLDEYQRRESDLQTSESKISEVREISIKSSALLSTKRPQEAVELLREALRSHPLNASLYRTMGLAQSALGLHREAIGTFETLVRLTPTDFLVHRHLASEHELVGNQDMARQQRVIYLQKFDIALLPN